MIPRFGRRDLVEEDIITTLERCGFHVERISAAGIPDLLLSRGGRWFVAEVKGAKGRLTKAQNIFHQQARAPIPILRSIEQAVEWSRSV